MRYLKIRTALLAASLLLGLAAVASAQTKKGEGTVSQRLEVMTQKLETMRRSLKSAASVLEQEGGDKKKDSKDQKENADTPYARLTTLEKEATHLQSEVNNLKGKVDRGEKYEAADVDQAEQSVAELQARVEKAQTETATARAAVDTPVGKERTVKKKGKFLGIFGGSGNDEYDELIGNVSPGRDRELFIVATREVRKKNFDVGRLLFQTNITTYPD
jgi:TolA-binding protein